MNDKIIILGGDGLVGSTFNYGKRLNRNDADLTDYESTYELIKKHKPLWVINCAGKVGGIKANMDNGFDFLEKNTLINLNVIKACRENKVPNLISFLSTCIFPDFYSQQGRLSEEHLHQGEPHESNYPYAYSKRMIDIMSRVARNEGFNYSCLVPTNLYGINDNYDLESSHLVPALIRKLTESLLHTLLDDTDTSKMPIEVWGSGQPIREFLFAEDIPVICNAIIENDIRFDNLIISNEPISINSLLSVMIHCYQNILSFLDTGLEFNWIPTYNMEMPDGQFAKITDQTKYENLINEPLDKIGKGFNLTPLSEGLNQTILKYLIKATNDIPDGYKSNLLKSITKNS